MSEDTDRDAGDACGSAGQASHAQSWLRTIKLGRYLAYQRMELLQLSLPSLLWY